MKQLPRTPKRFKTLEQRQIWHDACVGIFQLGLVDRIERKTIEAHVDAVVRIRDTQRKRRGMSADERNKVIAAAGRTVVAMYAPNIVRRSNGRMIEEIEKRLYGVSR